MWGGPGGSWLTRPVGTREERVTQTQALVKPVFCCQLTHYQFYNIFAFYPKLRFDSRITIRLLGILINVWVLFSACLGTIWRNMITFNVYGYNNFKSTNLEFSRYNFKSFFLSFYAWCKSQNKNFNNTSSCFFNNFFFSSWSRQRYVSSKTGQKLFSIFPQTLLVLYLLEVSIVTLKNKEIKQMPFIMQLFYQPWIR